MSKAVKILFGIKPPTMASKDDHSDLPEPDFMAQAKSITDKIPQETLDEKSQTREEAQNEIQMTDIIYSLDWNEVLDLSLPIILKIQ